MKGKQLVEVYCTVRLILSIWLKGVWMEEEYKFELDGVDSLVVSRMTYDDARSWDKDHRQKTQEEAGGWRISPIFLLVKVVKNTTIVLYVVKIKGVIVGMFVVNYALNCLDSNNGNIHHYLWLMAKSQEPNSDALLKAYAVQPSVRKSISFLAYAIIQHESKQRNCQMWLHADPSGGDGLLKMYKERDKFVTCDTRTRTKYLKKQLDDRFLYAKSSRMDEFKKVIFSHLEG